MRDGDTMRECERLRVNRVSLEMCYHVSQGLRLLRLLTSQLCSDSKTYAELTSLWMDNRAPPHVKVRTGMRRPYVLQESSSSDIPICHACMHACATGTNSVWSIEIDDVPYVGCSRHSALAIPCNKYIVMCEILLRIPKNQQVIITIVLRYDYRLISV
jgi:hypothetical protein